MGTSLDAPPPTTGLRVRWSRAVTRVRRAILTRRRALAALLVAAATAAGLQAVAAPPPTTVPVVVAARDLPAGATLTGDDLETASWPVDLAPEDRRTAVTDLEGGELVAAVAAGEPVTDTRLLGPGLAQASPGLTALPLRLPDPGVVELVRPGDRIDLIATDPADGSSRPLASDVLVLAVPASDATGSGGGGELSAGAGNRPGGSLVVVGVAPATALSLSGAALTDFLTVAFSR